MKEEDLDIILSVLALLGAKKTRNSQILELHDVIFG